MHMQVVTIFPEMVQTVTEFGVVGRAVERGLLCLTCQNPRDFADDAHRTVDDRPYGGGPGMVMKYAPAAAAIDAARKVRPA
jgi:tRNA (guanine37-N1)-methyltransferase